MAKKAKKSAKKVRAVKASATKARPAKARAVKKASPKGKARGAGASGASPSKRGKPAKPKLKLASAKPATEAAPKARAGKFVPAPAPAEPAQQTAARELAIAAARSLSDDKCSDIAVLDVRTRSSVTDFIVIASGTSDRQMRSAADSVRVLARQNNHQVVRDDGDDRTTWVVLDCVDVVVHVFEPTTRAHYDLEMMWGDAPRIEWARTEPPPASRRRTAATA